MNRQTSMSDLNQAANKMAGFMNQRGLDSGKVKSRANTLQQFSSSDGTVFMKAGSISSQPEKSNQKWRWTWPF